MSTSNEELLIKVSADANTAIKEINRLNKEVGTLTKQVDKSKTATARQKKSFDDLSKSTNKLSGLLGKVTLGLGAMGVAMKAVEFAKLAADAEQSEDAFNRVFDSMGQNAEDAFAKIKEASKGLVSETNIRQSVVTAESLGVPLEKMAELMKIARVQARVMGTDVKKAFEDLATGIGRGSPMILDNLGLLIKLEDANKEWAKSNNTTVKSMTKQQKQMALTNAVIKAAAKTIDRYKDSQLTAREEMQGFDATMRDLKENIGAGLLIPLNDLSQQLKGFIDGLDKDTIQNFSNSLGSLFTAIGYLGKAAAWLNDVLVWDRWVGEKDAGLLDTAAKGVIKLGDALSGTSKKIEDTSDLKPFDGFAKDIDSYIEKLNDMEETAKEKYDALSDEEKKVVLKDYTTQIKSHSDYLNTLIRQEKDAHKSIADANRELVKELHDIDKERFATNLDLDRQIVEIELGRLSKKQQYAAREILEAQALADALSAAKKGEADNAEQYLKQYETLATSSADRITKKYGSVGANDKQLAEERIKILKNIQDVENTILDTKEKNAKTENATAVDIHTKALARIKERSDAENESITKLAGKLAELETPTISEHTVEDNVPEILQEIEKLKVTTYSDHYITEHVTPARAGGGLIPQRLAVGGTFRGSGKVPGYDASDSDNVNAYLTGGEYVINRAAVDNIGISALNAINSFKMPKLPGYADGGLVGPSTSTSSSPPLQPVVINIGNSSLTAQMTPDMVMEALTLGLDSKGGF